MEKEITITQTLNRNQLTSVNILILLSGKLKIYIIIVLLAFIINLVYSLISDSFNLIDLAKVLLFVILVPYFLWRSIKGATQKNYESNSRFYENVNYTFKEENLKISGNNFENIYNWSELKKVKVTKNWILIFTSTNQAIAIDKNQQNKKVIEEIMGYFK